MKDKISFFSVDNKVGQFVILIVLGLTWGSSFILMKKGLVAFESFEVALIRLFFAFIVIFPFLIKELRSIPKDKYIWLALTGWLGNGLPAFLFALGISKIDSSLGGIINSTTPIFTLLIGIFFFGLQFQKSAVWGIVVGLLGTVYLIASGYKGEQDSRFVYALFPLLGSVLYGFSNTIIKIKLAELKPVVITASAFTALMPVIIPAFFLLGIPQKAVENEMHFIAFSYSALLGILGTSLAVIVYNYLIKHTSILFAASVTYIIPVFAMAWGFVFGEALSIHYFIGLAIIITGVWMVNKSGQAKGIKK